jgi:hypothetical protein
MRAEFYRRAAGDQIVGTARWSAGSRPSIQAEGQEERDRLERIFRLTPVVVDDPSLRSFGTFGPNVLQPGSLQWFQAAARTRGLAEGLGVRLVDEEEAAMGWEPAGAYRPFPAAIERKVTVGGPGAGRERTQPEAPGPEAKPAG